MSADIRGRAVLGSCRSDRQLQLPVTPGVLALGENLPSGRHELGDVLRARTQDIDVNTTPRAADTWPTPDYAVDPQADTGRSCQRPCVHGGPGHEVAGVMSNNDRGPSVCWPDERAGNRPGAADVPALRGLDEKMSPRQTPPHP